MTHSAHLSTPVPARAQDNLFGVCAALGADFGVDPLWLRVGFAVALLFNLELVLATYAALGLVVLASRLIAPDPKAVAPVEEARAEEPVAEEPMRRAA